MIALALPFPVILCILQQVHQRIFVRADMGNIAAEKLGMPAPLTPNDSVSGMLKVIGGLQQKDNGKFLDWEGKHMDY